MVRTLAMIGMTVLLAMTPLPASANTYTLTQVQQHAAAGHCLTIVGEGVYNLTAFLARHEAGRPFIESMCGIDATAAFNSEHGDDAKALATLAYFRIGSVAGAATPPAAPAPPTCPAKTRAELVASSKAAAAARKAAGSAKAAKRSAKFLAAHKRYTALHKAASPMCRVGLPTPAAIAR